MVAHTDSPHKDADPGISTSDLGNLEEFDEDLDDDDDDDDFEEEEAEWSEMESLLGRLSAERIVVRVNQVIIKGNTKTSDSLIASEVEPILRDASSFQQLLRAATVANARLEQLGVFDSVTITLDAGPPELPGSANVVIEVSEGKFPLSGELGIVSEPEARSCSLEGSLKLKNLFGYGDVWDSSVACGLDEALDVSTGVTLPRVRALATPLSARVSLLSPDWLKFSSSRKQVLGLSLGLLSSGNHDVSYNLSWRIPSKLSAERQLGRCLFSALKYAYKIDQRDSTTRPTRGYAFVSTAQIGGLFPDIKSSRLIRQEFDLRCATPLGFYRTALNFGISGGVVFPWGGGHLNTHSYFPERFFIGGNSSSVFQLRGPTSNLGFKADPRKHVTVSQNSDEGNTFTGLNHIEGALALTAFADLSFDLPLSIFREAGIHGHVFACSGSLNKLTENTYKEFSFQKFRDSFRSWAGFGIIIPTKLFRMEVNYCCTRIKSGVQLRFSSLQ